ncbi:PREDICTED: uncharacterized protein LOC109175147 [Ipomoea nil]|uniref:uncharacterized protein LOC109175147 n=1 Tax=Ipomoea nil TaxID=35883 RepID=UPI000901E1A9|nr:PREDICTED: uncharacterized protein LOC109175147 [Ipomoea nil]
MLITGTLSLNKEGGSRQDGDRSLLLNHRRRPTGELEFVTAFARITAPETVLHRSRRNSLPFVAGCRTAGRGQMHPRRCRMYREKKRTKGATTGLLQTELFYFLSSFRDETMKLELMER